MNQDTNPILDFFITHWKDHIIVYAIATWSGTVTWLHRRVARKATTLVKEPVLVQFAADIMLAGLVGMLMYWFLLGADISAGWAAGAAGIAAHTAPRTLWLLQRAIHRPLGLEKIERDEANDRADD